MEQGDDWPRIMPGELATEEIGHGCGKSGATDEEEENEPRMNTDKHG